MNKPKNWSLAQIMTVAHYRRARRSLSFIALEVRVDCTEVDSIAEYRCHDENAWKVRMRNDVKVEVRLMRWQPEI